MNLWIALLSIIFCSLIGIIKGRSFKHRVCQLEQSLVMLEKIQTYLRYEQMPTKDIIDCLVDCEELQQLCFLKLCHQQLKKSHDFPRLWTQSINQSANKMDFQKDDQKVLKMLGNILGSTNTENQLNQLELVRQLLEQSFQQATQEHQQKGKLFQSLGVLSGIAIAILCI